MSQEEALEQRALQRLRGGDIQGAHAWLVKLAQLRPHDQGLNARIKQVEELIRRRREAQARIHAEPLRYAHAYIQAGRLAEGLKLLRAALARDPDNERLRALAIEVARRLETQEVASTVPEPDSTAPPAALERIRRERERLKALEAERAENQRKKERDADQARALEAARARAREEQQRQAAAARARLELEAQAVRQAEEASAARVRLEEAQALQATRGRQIGRRPSAASATPPSKVAVLEALLSRIDVRRRRQP